jgi:protein-disulfide isomerase
MSPPALQALQEDIEHIKMELADIKKELISLRQLLSQRPAQAQQRVNPVARVSIADNPMLGKAEAPVTIIEFSDYQCPFCRRFFQTTLPTLKTEYVDTGKVRYIFRDFPIDKIHPQARKAAEAAHCAGEQNKYWEMHDLLFQNQNALKAENLQAYARSLGLEATAFDACLEQGKYAAKINTDYTDGSAAGITGTPSFFIGKTGSNETIEGTLIRGAQPLPAFRQEIDRLLEESK